MKRILAIMNITLCLACLALPAYGGGLVPRSQPNLSTASANQNKGFSLRRFGRRCWGSHGHHSHHSHHGRHGHHGHGCCGHH